jgi:hypothetical protein
MILIPGKIYSYCYVNNDRLIAHPESYKSNPSVVPLPGKGKLIYLKNRLSANNLVFLSCDVNKNVAFPEGFVEFYMDIKLLE